MTQPALDAFYRLGVGLRRLGLFAASPGLWFFLLATSGAALLVAGVYELAGIAWALVCAGVLSLGAAIMLLIGMTRAG